MCMLIVTSTVYVLFFFVITGNCKVK